MFTHNTPNYKIIPFFYIIEHIPSKKKYAGSKYGRSNKKTNSIDFFMKPDGYTTSSKVVNNLIQLDGLDSFKIIKIILNHELANPSINPENIDTIQKYESWFIHNNDCINSNDWLNIANCSYTQDPGIHSDKYRSFMSSVQHNGLTGYQNAALKGAETMKIAGIRENAAKKTANTRKNKQSYGKYIILNEFGEIAFECNGDFQHICFNVLKLPKSVFFDLRDKGKIEFTNKDAEKIKKYSDGASQFCQKLLNCSLYREKYNNWTCISL